MAIFLWRHAQGGGIKLPTAVLQVRQIVSISSLVDWSAIEQKMDSENPEAKFQG